MDQNSIGNVVTVGFIAGTVAAFLNQIFGISRDFIAARYGRKKSAGYHALQLAVILEGYAYECASFVGYNGNAQRLPDEEFPDWKVTLPELPDYPENEEGWKAISISLAARVLDLRNHIIGRQGTIRATVEHSQQDLGDVLDEEACSLGLEAWAIAKDLRSKNGLSPFDSVWDFPDELEKTKAKAIERRQARNKRNAELWVEIAAGQRKISPSHSNNAIEEN